MSTAEFLAILMAAASLLGSGAIFWNARSQNRKNNGDAAEAITKAAANLIGPLETKITQLTARCDAQDREISQLKLDLAKSEKQAAEYLAGIMLLTHQLVANKLEPVYRPPVRTPGTGPLGEAKAG